jgi:suppressor of G2 allele of SKP1
VIIELRKKNFNKSEIKGGSKIKYSWYQTPSKVGIEIPHALKEKKDLVVKFTKNSVSIDFPLDNSENYHIDLDLFEQIIPDRSKKIHRLETIEVMMEKKEQNLHWVSLRKDG